MTQPVTYPTFAQALIAEGYKMPTTGVAFTLENPVDGVYQLQFVITLSPADMALVGRAIARMGVAIQPGK